MIAGVKRAGNTVVVIYENETEERYPIGIAPHAVRSILEGKDSRYACRNNRTEWLYETKKSEEIQESEPENVAFQ